MALKIVTKPKEQQTEVTQLSDIADTIDEVGELQTKINALVVEIAAKTQKENEKLLGLQKKLAPLMAEVGEVIQSTYEDEDADGTFVEKGKKFQADIGKKGNERKIKEAVPEGDITVPGTKKLMELMGEDTFFKLVKMNLKDIDAYLDPSEKEQVLDCLRTKRPFTVAKKV